ncbi:DUF805 domain-containing protein [Weissella coleopterorum]|uniref:DUF805 domain-containing protein n=1 Tax=Weissella coleopterorum TaxID=2714949 RepID=A0A6G8AY85_9LACO|nr:DUF805 domain-containing protein [Weissella coleopterorum]QIL49940.1 DUF805 domain-containing protein [Weissella coleopterorum]
MISFWQAFKNYWRRGVDFRGKSTRAEYWWMVLWAVLFSVILLGGLAISMFLWTSNHGIGQIETLIFKNIIYFLILTIVISVILIIPTTALTVRRLRDTGFKTWLIWVLILLNYVFNRMELQWHNWWQILLSLLSLLISLIMFLGLVMKSDSLRLGRIKAQPEQVKVETLYPIQVKTEELTMDTQDN